MKRIFRPTKLIRQPRLDLEPTMYINAPDIQHTSMGPRLRAFFVAGRLCDIKQMIHEVLAGTRCTYQIQKESTTFFDRRIDFYIYGPWEHLTEVRSRMLRKDWEFTVENFINAPIKIKTMKIKIQGSDFRSYDFQYGPFTDRKVAILLDELTEYLRVHCTMISVSKTGWLFKTVHRQWNVSGTERQLDIMDEILKLKFIKKGN